MSVQLPRIAYRSSEAAESLGISERTLASWMQSDNPPPSIKRGNVLLYPHTALVAWLDNQVESEQQRS